MERISTEHTEDYRCRVCLQLAEGMICLFNTTKIKTEALSYWDILQSICKLELEKNINTPQKICEMCAQGAEASYEFKVLCESSDKILQKELNPNTCDIEYDQDDFKIEINEEEIYCIKESMTDLDDISNENSIDTTTNIIQTKQEHSTSNFSSTTTICESIFNENNIEDTSQSSGDAVEIEENSNVNVKPDSNNHCCKYCGRSFHLKRNLELHLVMKKCSKRTYPVTCFSCNYQPASFIDYNEHRKMHLNNCMYCDYTHTGNTDYQWHLKEFHSDKKLGCEFCTKIYFRPRFLGMHMKQEHPDEEIRCNICNFVTNIYQLYTKHINEEHSEILQPNHCKFCDYSNVCPIALGIHMALSHDDKKNIQCTKCEKKFFNKRRRESHMKTQHRKNDPIVCEICGKHFKVPQNLVKHMTIHSGEKNFECKLCGKRFRTSDRLYSHNTVHSEEKRYKCDECSTQYKTSSGLRRHVLVFHKQMKSHECSVCGKKFVTKTSLKEHLIIHTGMKNYECITCGKLFGRKTQLVQHLVVHTRERRHVCEICGKGFTQAHVLRTHLNTHKN